MITNYNFSGPVVPVPDTIFFYNMDYSFWKQIVCPYIPSFVGQYNCYNYAGSSLGIFYPSETLFNTDTFLEVAVVYMDSIYHDRGKYLIINENGAIVDSMLNAVISFTEGYKVYNDPTSGTFKLIVPTLSGSDIYSLPGSLPCESCVTGSFLTERKNPNTIITEPMPNPSKDQVKIAFILPEGVSRGELQLFNNNGVRLKTWEVDSRFGYIMLDNSQLAAGMYYYNIVVNGAVSSTQKLLVVR